MTPAHRTAGPLLRRRIARSMYNTDDELAQGDLWIIEGIYEPVRHGSLLLADGPPLERRQPTAQVAHGTTPVPDASFPLRRLCGHHRDPFPNAIARSGLPAKMVQHFSDRCSNCCLRLPAARRSIVAMTPSAMKHKPTAGALRAARAILLDTLLVESLAELVDRETGQHELLSILESILAQAGDLIESRSPELVAQAREALRRYGDETPPQAE